MAEPGNGPGGTAMQHRHPLLSVLTHTYADLIATMDDDRTLARIERRLVREDPELADRIDALNRQFSDEQGSPVPTPGPGPGAKARGRFAPFSWRMWAGVLVLLLIFIAGLAVGHDDTTGEPEPSRTATPPAAEQSPRIQRNDPISPRRTRRART